MGGGGGGGKGQCPPPPSPTPLTIDVYSLKNFMMIVSDSSSFLHVAVLVAVNLFVKKANHSQFQYKILTNQFTVEPLNKVTTMHFVERQR